MRVISGSVRGKKLISPQGDSVRPTLDRIKESVFNMIAFFLQDAHCLDLFAGSGALGIEALSRGAKDVVFVDISEDSLSVTKKNLDITSFKDNAKCILSDYSSFLKSSNDSFDIIFLDPPYALGLLDEALKLIHDRNLLSKNGYIICETDGELDFIPDEKLFDIYRNKRYGRVQIFLLTCKK